MGIRTALINLLGGKTEETTNKYKFSSEDRERSAEIRTKQNELKLKKLEKEYELEQLKMQKEQLRLQQEIDEIKGDDEEDYEDEEDSNPIEQLLMASLLPLIQKQTAGSSNPTPNDNTPSTNSKPAVVSYSEEQLKEMLKQVPKPMLKKLKSMTDIELIQQVKQQLPNIADESLNTALKLLRNN